MRILDVGIKDVDGQIVTNVCAGSIVRLVVTAEATEALGNAILGFNLKDRLGQHLFGENTFAALHGRTTSLMAGDRVTAEFVFQMPVLHRGNYTIAAAAATGEPNNHRQQHWVHDALALTSTTEWPHPGLVGYPMLEVRLALAKPPTS